MVFAEKVLESSGLVGRHVDDAERARADILNNVAENGASTEDLTPLDRLEELEATRI